MISCRHIKGNPGAPRANFPGVATSFELEWLTLATPPQRDKAFGGQKGLFSIPTEVTRNRW